MYLKAWRPLWYKKVVWIWFLRIHLSPWFFCHKTLCRGFCSMGKKDLEILSWTLAFRKFLLLVVRTIAWSHLIFSMFFSCKRWYFAVFGFSLFWYTSFLTPTVAGNKTGQVHYSSRPKEIDFKKTIFKFEVLVTSKIIINEHFKTSLPEQLCIYPQYK